MVRLFMVGGSVRDYLLGITPKDADYAVEADSLESMIEYIESQGGKIFQIRPQYLTVRATMPSIGPADFVLCRKEGAYRDGRHPEEVQVGTIYDDLMRRDFTVNAMAIEVTPQGLKEIIDPHNGLMDLHRGILNTVRDPEVTFSEDYLRMIRALRFKVTHQFKLTDDINKILSSDLVFNIKLLPKERIYDELKKMLLFDTKRSIYALYNYHKIASAIFDDGRISLSPIISNTTDKQKND